MHVDIADSQPACLPAWLRRWSPSHLPGPTYDDRCQGCTARTQKMGRELHAVHELKKPSTLLPAATCFSGKLAAAVSEACSTVRQDLLLDCHQANIERVPAIKTPSAVTLSGELNVTRTDPASVLYQLVDVGVPTVQGTCSQLLAHNYVWFVDHKLPDGKGTT